MPTTAERLAKLEQMAGVAFADRPITDADLIPANEIPGSGRYPWILTDFQLHRAAKDLYTKVEALPGSTPQPSQAPIDASAVIAKLATDYDVHFVVGKMGIGMIPEPDAHAQLQLCGERAAILGRSNMLGTDTQNPGEVHTNEIHIVDNDGGLRFLQYGFWGKNGFIRNTLNRAFSVVALDSEGDICQSKVAVGATHDGGQLWYIITDFSRKIVQFGTFQAGWQVEIRETVSAYSDRLRKRL